MRTRRGGRGTAAVAAAVVLLGACGGGSATSDGAATTDEAGDAGAQDGPADTSGDASGDDATIDMDTGEDATVRIDGAALVAAVAAPPGMAADGTADLQASLTGIGLGPDSDGAAVVMAGLASQVGGRWTRPAGDDGRLDVLAVVVATYDSPEAASTAFDAIAVRAEEGIGNGELGGASVGIDGAIAIDAPTMVQIDPNSGEQVGPTPSSTVAFVRRGDAIVVIDVLWADEAAADGSLVAAAAAALDAHAA